MSWRIKVVPSRGERIPEFPQELTDYIIDFLWDDRASLLNCCLTCRAWLPASRFQLFCRVNLQSQSTFDYIKGIVLRRLEMRRHLRHIHQLSISPPNNEVDWPVGQPWAHLVPYVLAGQIPHLGCLYMRNFSSRSLPLHPTFFAQLCRLRSLTWLAFHDSIFPNINVFHRLICSLPFLSTLALDCVSFGSHCTLSPTAFHKGDTPLRSLILRNLADPVSVALSQWISTAYRAVLSELEIAGINLAKLEFLAALERGSHDSLYATVNYEGSSASEWMFCVLSVWSLPLDIQIIMHRFAALLSVGHFTCVMDRGAFYRLLHQKWIHSVQGSFDSVPSCLVYCNYWRLSESSSKDTQQYLRIKLLHSVPRRRYVIIYHASLICNFY